MEILVTDDEVVAIAIRGAQVWPGPLITVDDRSAESVLLAGARGERSLAVRGIDTESNETVAFMRQALSSEKQLVLSARTSKGELAAGTSVLVHFRLGGADGGVVQTLTSDGVSWFGSLNDDEFATAMRQWLADVQAMFKNERDELAEWLFLVEIGENGNRRALVVGPSGIAELAAAADLPEGLATAPRREIGEAEFLAAVGVSVEAGGLADGAPARAGASSLSSEAEATA
jgi:hypothetical protein